ncbi:MAG: DUF4430 domain-containing protein [Acutalibacteraceae bacterium]
MKKTNFKKILSLLLIVCLIATIGVTLAACDSNKGTPDTTTPVTTTENVTDKATATELGKGETKFDLIVTDADGKETKFVINTDKTTVGEALLDCKLIAGDESEYGLYVKTVNGVTADYDKDGTYWAFYINGEYALTGVDATDIEENATYEFRIEKA